MLSVKFHLDPLFHRQVFQFLETVQTLCCLSNHLLEVIKRVERALNQVKPNLILTVDQLKQLSQLLRGYTFSRWFNFFVIDEENVVVPDHFDELSLPLYLLNVVSLCLGDLVDEGSAAEGAILGQSPLDTCFSSVKDVAIADQELRGWSGGDVSKGWRQLFGWQNDTKLQGVGLTLHATQYDQDMTMVFDCKSFEQRDYDLPSIAGQTLLKLYQLIILIQLIS